METALKILLGVALAVVAAILATGLGVFAKGGDFHRRHANTLMRLRVAAQFAAVALFALLLWIRRG